MRNAVSKIPLRCLLVLGLAAAIWIPGWASGDAELAERITLESIFLDESFEGPEIDDIQWLPDGSAYLVQEEDEESGETVWMHYRMDSEEGEEWLRLLPPADSEITDLVFSDENDWALLRCNEVKRWRHSRSYDHWILHIPSRELKRLSAAGGEMHARFSPDSSKIAFVRDGNLFVRSQDEDEPRALSSDGSDVVFNGDPDWVYEEEFGILEAWWWSPDGESLAYLHSESEAIGRFPLVTMGEGAYPELQMLPYPKAGSDNSRVSLRVASVENGESEEILALGPDDGYFARVDWSQDSGRVVYQYVNRAQNHLQLWAASVVDPTDVELWLEEDSPAWVEVRDDLKILDDGRLLWTSERDGYRHVYMRERDGELRQLTHGAWEVRGVESVDEERGTAILTTGRDSHLENQIDLLDLRSGAIRRAVSDGGWHSLDISPDGKWLLDRWSSSMHRPQVAVRTAEGEHVRWAARDDMEDLSRAPLPEERFYSFESEDGIEFFARILLPPDFDESRRYPTLMYCYGGPESQTVANSWITRGRALYHRMLAQDGMIVFFIDGRGTGGRGRDFKSAVYRRLGQLEADDQLTGVDHLRSLPYVDAERIAIWGWSYGGYLSAMTLLKSEGRVRAAISVAPVSDWSFYDTIYTERYMGTPQDNPDGYQNGSLLGLAPALQGQLLLIHGLGDDNVHPQNTIRLMTELQSVGKNFEVMFYPDKNHGISGEETRFHLYRTMRDFLVRALNIESAEAP
jgi:dipeptidyl-peptidase-4